MKTLAVRFEGTLVKATPKQGADLEWGEPIPEAVEALKALAPHYEIIVVSTAAGTSRGLQHLISWLQEHEVPYWDVWAGFSLPTFDVMLDDQSLPLDDVSLAKLGVVLPKEKKS